jgi:hypothetical protein
MTFNYPHSQSEADALISFFGMAAMLRRVGSSPEDRPCTVVVNEYDPHEVTALANPTDRKVLLSPIDPSTGDPLEIAPDNEQDQLVTFVQPPASPPVIHEILPMTCKPKPTAPGGVTVLWEFTVRR